MRTIIEKQNKVIIDLQEQLKNLQNQLNISNKAHDYKEIALNSSINNNTRDLVNKIDGNFSALNSKIDANYNHSESRINQKSCYVASGSPWGNCPYGGTYRGGFGARNAGINEQNRWRDGESFICCT